MDNQELAKVFFGIAGILERQNVDFKPAAYRKAGNTIKKYPEYLGDVYKRGGLKALEDLPGIGIHIAKKIEELVNTGKLQYYEHLKAESPADE